MKRWSFALALGIGLMGCGGGGVEPDTVARTEVQKQCDALMGAWCRNAMVCVWCETAEDCEAKGLPPELVLTESEMNDELDVCVDVAKGSCDAVVDASSNYDACLASVEPLSDADCEAVRTAIAARVIDGSQEPVPMPASCAGLFSG